MERGAPSLLERLQRAGSEFLLHPAVSAIARHWRQEYGLLIVTIAAAAIAAQFVRIPGKAPDFTVFWAAATNAFGPVYDSSFLTPLQNGPPGERPFANPPTFLLLLLPLGLLPFKAAYVAWVSLSVAAFFATGLKLTRFAWLAIFSPTLHFVALIGQTSLVAGSLAVLGMVSARRNAILSGVALGLAACIKPQLVLLAPIALLLARDFRALSWAALTVTALALATAIVFGLSIWSDWLQSLSGFREIVGQLAIGQLALPPIAWLRALAGILILALMILAARRDDRPRLIISTIGGGLLLSPYSAHYESVVLLLPALALLRLDWRIVPIAYMLRGGAVTAFPFAIVVALLALPRRATDNRVPTPSAS